MSYVVKIGEYYVRDVNSTRYTINNQDTKIQIIGDIILSKEMMRGYDKELAKVLAKKLNGIGIELPDQVTICEEG